MKKIYIVHGWTYTLEAWNTVTRLLTDKGIEIVMLNVPGLTEKSDLVWTLDMYVDWLTEKLQNETNATLLGHSNGGRIALAYTSKYPEKVQKLILIDSAGIVHKEFLLELKRKIFGGVARLGKKVVSSNTLRKIFYRLIGARDYERAPENMRETMAHLITQDLEPLLPTISCPTLLIWGEKDTATPLSDAYIMKNKIPNSKLIVIPNAGHSPYKTNPTEVVSAIISN